MGVGRGEAWRIVEFKASLRPCLEREKISAVLFTVASSLRLYRYQLITYCFLLLPVSPVSAQLQT
jgi:hypothetical protein